MEFTTEDFRHAHLRAALALHAEHIVDESGSLRLELMFRRVGWGGFVARGYKNTSKFAWCGIFVAVSGLDVGDHLVEGQCVAAHLDPGIAKFVLPSTQRLQSSAKWAAAGAKKAALHDLRWENPDVYLRPGVVATIATREYGDVRDRVGGHYVIVEHVRDGRVDTVEGNAFGELGDGSWGEGVVRRRGDKARHIEDFRFAVGWDDSHFEVMDA